MISRLRLLAPLLLLIVCAGALRIRYQDPYDLVLTQDEVVLRSNDPWYHMRLVDNFIHSFPHRLTFDPYAVYPKGQDVGCAALLDLLVTLPSIMFGWEPSSYWTMMLAAMLPPLLGALVLIPVFLMGRALFQDGEWVGLLAAAIVAFAPGQFMVVTLIGFFDHHVLEVLFSTLVVFFAIRALQSKSNKYGILAGLSLGLYLLAWQGGVVFVAILLAWFTFQCVVLDERPLKLALAMFPAALAVLLPFTPWGGLVQRPALAVFAAGAAAIMMCLASRKWVLASLLLPVLALAVLSTGLFNAVQAHVFLLDYFRRSPQVWEIRPLLFATGRFSLGPALDEFGQSAWLVVPGLALVAWQWLRLQKRRTDIGFFLAVSCGWLAGMLIMRRFAYYFLIYAALLGANLCAELARALARRTRTWAAPVMGIVAAAALIAPSLAPALVAGQPDLSRLTGASSEGPGLDWRESLEWMRNHTPEPLGSADAYYQVFDAKTFRYPPTAYGVMVWGTEGFWVTRIAHRIPVDNATWTGSPEAASFYVEQEPDAAARQLDRLGVRYILAPFSIPLVAGPRGDSAAGEFVVMAAWVGRDLDSYAERYYFPALGRNKLLYYPAYFQAMGPRLSLFGGLAVEPEHVGLVEFQREGKRNVVTRYRDFTNYAEAQRAQAAAPGSRIVSEYPRKSCVPLPALSRFKMIHHSPNVAGSRDEDIFEVEVYEYR